MPGKCVLIQNKICLGLDWTQLSQKDLFFNFLVFCIDRYRDIDVYVQPISNQGKCKMNAKP